MAEPELSVQHGAAIPSSLLLALTSTQELWNVQYVTGQFLEFTGCGGLLVAANGQSHWSLWRSGIDDGRFRMT